MNRQIRNHGRRVTVVDECQDCGTLELVKRLDDCVGCGMILCAGCLKAHAEAEGIEPLRAEFLP